MNYQILFAEQAEKHPDKAFLQWDGKSYSYQKFSALLEKIEKEIATVSLSGKIVGIYSYCSIFQLSLFLAIQKKGGIPILIHGHVPIGEIVEIMEKNKIHNLISDEEIQNEKFFSFQSMASMTFYFTQSDTSAEERFLIPEAIFGVLTSGSTSIPKILFRTFQSWADFFPIQNEVFQIDSKTILYLQGSFSFTGNLNMVLSVLAVGGTLIGSSHLRAKRWIQEIEKFSSTHMYLIPAKLSALTSQIKTPIGSVQKILSGSQLLHEKAVKKLYQGFPSSEIILYYGASETNYISWLTGKEILKKPESVGKPFPQVEVWVEKGEIFVDSEYLAIGVSKPCTVGDRGWMDEAGDLIFQGRGDDHFNIRGSQISKIKILKSMEEIPEIKEAEVLSFRDEKNELRLAAFLVADPATKRKIVRELKQFLRPWEIPTRFYFFSELPMTSAGKVDRRQLLKQIKKPNH